MKLALFLDVLGAARGTAAGRAVPPPDSRVVVVRARIRDHFARIVVRPERRRLRVAAERELQNRSCPG